MDVYYNSLNSAQIMSSWRVLVYAALILRIRSLSGQRPARKNTEDALVVVNGLYVKFKHFNEERRRH